MKGFVDFHEVMLINKKTLFIALGLGGFDAFIIKLR